MFRSQMEKQMNLAENRTTDMPNWPKLASLVQYLFFFFFFFFFFVSMLIFYKGYSFNFIGQ